MDDHALGTFFHLPDERCNPETARYHVLPIPYEGTVCFMHGTAQGPAAILDVSDQAEHFDEELLTDFTVHGIATLPPVPAADTPEEEFQRIYETVRQHDLFRVGRLPIILGGEHGITPPIIKAAVEKYPNLSILQFDAHADLRNEYTGFHYSHATAMRRSLEFASTIIQVGIRSFSEEEYHDCPQLVRRFITPLMLEKDFAYSLDKILFGLTDDVYITIDIDALDPSEAPGTGTPEPGGIRWRQLIGILKKVCATKNIVGADIVEVAPLGGNNRLTEFLAARLAAKLMAYTAPVAS